jgi:hypothetical protein
MPDVTEPHASALPSYPPRGVLAGRAQRSQRRSS